MADVVEQRTSHTREVLGYITAGAVVALITHRIWIHLVEPGTRVFGNRNDLHGHLSVAVEFSLAPLRIPTQDFGFHVSTRLLARVFGLDTATVIVLVLASLVIGVAAAWWGRTTTSSSARLTWPATLAFVTLVVLYDSPALVWHLRRIATGSEFIPIHVWDSPTEVSGLGLEMAMLVSVLILLDRALMDRSNSGPSRDHARTGPSGDHARTLRVARWLPVLTVVSTIFRPSMTIVLCGALPVYMILRCLIRLRFSRELLLRFWLPGIITLAVEVAVLKLDPRLVDRSSLSFAPFEVFTASNAQILPGWSYWSTLAIVPAALLVSGRRWWNDTGVQLTGCALAAGLVPTTLLVQVGPEAADGNVAKLALIGLVMLTFASLRNMVESTQDLLTPGTRASVATWTRTVAGWSIVWLGVLGGTVLILYVAGLA